MSVNFFQSTLSHEHLSMSTDISIFMSIECLIILICCNLPASLQLRNIVFSPLWLTETSINVCIWGNRHLVYNHYKTLSLYFARWVFKQLYDKGLIYRGVKVMPFSTACNTPLSNFESHQNYKVCMASLGIELRTWKLGDW